MSEQMVHHLTNTIRSVVAKYIHKVKTVECYGCQISHPSQKQHTCLDENDVVIDKYFDVGFEHVSYPVITALYAFEDLYLPVHDFESYKADHKDDVRSGMESIFSTLPDEHCSLINNFSAVFSKII